MCIKKVKNNKNILQKTFYGNQFAISEFFIHAEGYHIHKKMILLYLIHFGSVWLPLWVKELILLQSKKTKFLFKI